MEIAVQFRLIFLRAKEAFLEGKKMQKRFNSSLDWWDCVYYDLWVEPLWGYYIFTHKS